jgi:hypothetical protein
MFLAPLCQNLFGLVQRNSLTAGEWAGWPFVMDVQLVWRNPHSFLTLPQPEPNTFHTAWRLVRPRLHKTQQSSGKNLSANQNAPHLLASFQTGEAENPAVTIDE